MKGIIAGIVAGIVGALLWAIFAALTGFEIGWIAWGIGAAVGAAVAWGTEGSPTSAFIAVIITIFAILGGKFAAVEMILSKEIKATNQEIVQMIYNDNEYIISWVADDIISELEQRGETIEWPEGVDPQNVTSKTDYPGFIWGVAEQSWNARTDEEKAEFRKAVEEQVNENIRLFASEARGEGFLESFGIIDIIFFFLAIGTAYKVATKSE